MLTQEDWLKDIETLCTKDLAIKYLSYTFTWRSSELTDNTDHIIVGYESKYLLVASESGDLFSKQATNRTTFLLESDRCLAMRGYFVHVPEYMHIKYINSHPIITSNPFAIWKF